MGIASADYRAYKKGISHMLKGESWWSRDKDGE